MNLPTCFRSPLAATAGVILVMALIAIPLHQLTSDHDTPPVTATRTDTRTLTPAWISLRLLSPVKSATLQSADGDIIWKLDATPAGEVEIRKPLPILKHRLELILHIKWAEGSPESAAFLSIAPDGLETSTQYLIGRETSRELLTFTWPNG